MAEKSNKLSKVLDDMKSRTKYRSLDNKALDVSRAMDAGCLGDNNDNFTEWAALTNDPLVVINNVKPQIEVIHSRLCTHPSIPKNEILRDKGNECNIQDTFNELKLDTLKDGWGIAGVSVDQDGKVNVKKLDARYIMFDGMEPTLRDASNVIVFDILPYDFSNDVDHRYNGNSIVCEYGVVYDTNYERVKTSHYHKITKEVEDFDENGKKVKTEIDQWVVDIYEWADEEPTQYELGSLDRPPVIRFYGDGVELSDKRMHYRGIYYSVSSVLKALALSATKVQTGVATVDDDSYIADSLAIEGKPEWDNVGVKTFDSYDKNNNLLGGKQGAVVPIPKDHPFLLQSTQLWMGVIDQILGNTIKATHDGKTEQEVNAMDEVREALATIYATRFSRSIEEVFRVINTLLNGATAPVQMVGGYIEHQQQKKHVAEIDSIYAMAKESGLNVQGLVKEKLQLMSLATDVKERIAATFNQDPFASPLVQQLKTQLQQAQQQIQQQQFQMALLKTQASQRLERQTEHVQMQERKYKNELAYKQWAEEHKDVHDGYMTMLKAALDNGDMLSAFNIMEQMKQVDPVVALTEQAQVSAEQNIDEYDMTTQNQLNQVPNNIIPFNGGNV